MQQLMQYSSLMDEWLSEVEAALKNPYLDPEATSRARQWLSERDGAERAGSCLERDDSESALRSLLAVGEQQALVHQSAGQVLPLKDYPQTLWKRLGMPRSRLLRVCMASARCQRALAELRGSSESIRRVRQRTWAVCFGSSLLHALELEQVIRDHDVLILGETGTGKELVAQAIHAGTLGPEDGGPAPLSALNAAAVPETLVESELFGHNKGAFTGAREQRTGRLRKAHLGSFFLDEVGDLRPSTQVKLLRVMETNEVTPLGADTAHLVDVRYIAATHKSLDDLVEAGSFREDLYQRLAGNVILLPPLRQRAEDIVEIGRAFMDHYVPEGSASVDSRRILAWLRRCATDGQPWPGNVRQLQNQLRDMMLGLQPAAHSVQIGPARRDEFSSGVVPADVCGLQASLQRVSDWYVCSVVERHENNLSRAARTLGIDRGTLYRRLGAARKRLAAG